MFSSLHVRLTAINNNKYFQAITVLVIVLAALTIGANTFELPESFNVAIYWLDKFILLFFLVELVINFFSYKNKWDFFKSGWNWFDAIIVIGSLIPTAGQGILIARLLRVFRVLRLVSAIPQLKILINALFKAIPKMGYIAVLMFIIFYIYAVIGSLVFSDINEVLWGDVSISMLTLFRVATFEDWTDVMYETMAVYSMSWFYYLTFIFLTAFVFLNMMIGVVIETMTAEHAIAEQDKDSDMPLLTPDHEPRQIFATHKQVESLQKELSEIKALLKQKNGQS
ncbi:ion transporter [Vibrio genomosp. F10]|uniref:Ion transporter n=1 Tax=Vibrio genomosp. F10 TaxID=723171 RepID=A0A1B9R0V9_9VIBR|nr:ion transporter [Vibrio genomosp. F10]OCH77929.1 ion transporter [Vibrio genomosp. F10]OEF04988.1 ion transporter [Vibrio genomosp. F10 str. 9ZB36]OEF05900.1 ion transporter [Vibrio genomosp. F10 str. 9ZD137]